MLTAFGVTSLTVAVLTPQGEARCRQLLAWTERLLRETGTERFAALFRFSGQDAAVLAPVDVFLAPTWVVPFGRDLVPLLEPRIDPARGEEGG